MYLKTKNKNGASLKARLLEKMRLETGFSMLEAVVVVGVLLALAVGGFFAYGSITENAKISKVKSESSALYTSAQVSSSDGIGDTSPQDSIDKYNESTDDFHAVISNRLSSSETGTFTADPGTDFCVTVENLKTSSISATSGDCSVSSDSPSGTFTVVGEKATAPGGATYTKAPYVDYISTTHVDAWNSISAYYASLGTPNEAAAADAYGVAAGAMTQTDRDNDAVWSNHESVKPESDYFYEASFAFQDAQRAGTHTEEELAPMRQEMVDRLWPVIMGQMEVAQSLSGS